jgi:glycosyltransferase involved in cell wall biosynthesis
MRMQLSAPWFAEKIIEQLRNGACFESILTSTFIDVAVLRSLLMSQGIRLPLGVYFHENQFSYPGQVHDSGMFQFTSINFTSALCADSLAFNSSYNLETFLKGIRSYLNKATDMELQYLAETIRAKSVILYPGIDFSSIDVAPDGQKNDVPVLVWNHRWEHDKDPETFFQTLFALQELQFNLIVLGQQFRRQPEIFARAQHILAGRLLHFGFAEKKSDYAGLLKRGDIVVSTARHEFFGMSVLEGVRAGCRPLVPDRLSYRELFAAQYRYPEHSFRQQLTGLLKNFVPLNQDQARAMTDACSWPNLADRYRDWLSALESSRKEYN